ncbi:MAG: ribosome maturation factor RimM [bacterium]
MSAGDGRSALPAWDDLVIVGETLRPHGVAGDLIVRPVGDDAAALLALTTVFIGNDAGSVRQYTVKRLARLGLQINLALEGITDREHAARLAGKKLLIPAADAPPLPDARAYIFQLIGLRVVARDGADLGEITDVLENPGNDVWVAKSALGEYLIPAVDSIVLEIDVPRGRVVIDPIPGLLPDAPAKEKSP